MISERYAKAYKEVIEVLKHTKREDVNKIPRYKVFLWKTNMKKDYDFKLQKNKPLEEQGLSTEAQAIIANLYKNYWATDDEREEIEAKEKQAKELVEEEKFGSEDLQKIFKANEIRHEEESCISVVVKEEKETFFSKMLNKIKKIFNR